MAANAARAVAAGLPARPGSSRPPLYSFDPGTGRLAVTTPRYNTAITAVTNGAYPYGGIDLARLYDGRQEIAATLGARVPATFGIVARNRRGRIRLATARPASSRAGRPLRLLRAPRGVGSAGSKLRPFAGPFDVLRVTGRRAAAGVEARSTYSFRRNSIIGEWTVRATTSRRRSAEALFPSTGGERAAVWAMMRDGQAVRVTEPRPLRGVAAFYVQSERSGYVVEPIDRIKGATASLIQPRRQPSAPDPGPTLSVRLTGRLTRKRPVHFSARIAVAASLDEARAAYGTNLRACREAGPGVSRGASCPGRCIGPPSQDATRKPPRRPPHLPHPAEVQPSARQRGQHPRDGVLNHLVAPDDHVGRFRAARTGRRRP